MADTEGKTEEPVEAVSAELEATSEEPSSQGDGEAPTAEITSQLMSNPMVLAALQQKLGSMVGGSSGYIQSLPKVVKRRIKALKKLQFEATKIEAEFYREVHRLECEYAAKYAPLFEKRSTMVTGVYEPDDGEADWPSDDEKDDLAVSSSNEEVKNKANIEEKTEESDEKTEEKDENVKGIPGFWLTIFKNVDMLSEMIQAHDEPILNTLQDVKVEFKEKDPMGFTLEFYFEPNDFFENKKLTKEYTMRSEPDEADPFSFEGPEIVKCQGCKIDWKKGKNVTVKTVKKKQKHKASGTTRTISKTVQSDSFFNFFTPPSPPDDEEMDEDTEALLAADFEIGHFIRERIVPRAVLYFTGEALENDDEFEEGEEEEGGEEGEYDEDGDPDFNPGGVKFVSPSFHAHVAQLALGRVSKPSSAPPDTRLLLRPSTAASTHKPSGTRPDLPSRPGTAPIGSKGCHTPEATEPPPKPNTNAFQEVKAGAVIEHKPESVSGSRSSLQSGSASKSERPKSVSFSNRTVAVNHTGKHVGGEDGPARTRKAEALTNAMEPEVVDKDLKPDRTKITRELTFYEKTGGMRREKTFITSRSGKGERVRNPELQPLVEVSTAEQEECNVPDSEANYIAAPGGRKKPNAEKIADKKRTIQKADSVTDQSKKLADAQDEKRKGTTETGGQPNIPMAKSAVSQGENADLSGDQHSEKAQGQVGNRKASRHSEVKQEASEEGRPVKDKHGKGGTGKTAKDEARNILQRLTGKQSHQQRQGQQRPHRAGQVPTVGRPRRKYVFDKPADKPPEAAGVDNKPASAPPGQGRGHTSPGDRRGGLNQPASSVPVSLNRQDGRRQTGNASTGATAGEVDNRNIGIKPASAPAHRVNNQHARSLEQVRTKPQGVPQAKEANKSQAGESKEEDPKQDEGHGSRPPAIAEQRANEKLESRDKQRKSREVTSSGYNTQMELRKSGHVKQKVDSKHEYSGKEHARQKEWTTQADPSDQRERRTAGSREVTVGGPSRGVRMQNAMINSSLEASGPAEVGGELDEEGWEDEDMLGGLHPKLRDSPYLKDNRLLMPRSGKSRPGATLSATSSKRGGGNAS